MSRRAAGSISRVSTRQLCQKLTGVINFHFRPLRNLKAYKISGEGVNRRRPLPNREQTDTVGVMATALPFDFMPIGSTLIRDPYPVYDQMRDAGRVLQTPYGVTLIHR